MQQLTNRTLTQLLSAKRIASEHFDEAIHFDGQHRSAAETDGDKISFADGFRALQDKTQVHDRVQRTGNHRSRLTHSNEVSHVGRSLGVALGARMCAYYGLHAAPAGEAYWRTDPADIGHTVMAACLAHDVGNPPFGHDGEDAISEFFRSTDAGQKAVKAAGPVVGAELCQHEGNAQGFRMITRSMGWRDHGGLNLTAATLGAFGKYPFALKPGAKKYGVHRADMETMEFVALSTGMRRNGDGWFRHPFAWLMEAADDICYLTVDLEDAAWLGMVSLDELCELYQPVIGAEETTRARRMEYAPQMIQYMRSRMIKALINSCVEIYVDIADKIDDGTLGSTEHGSGILAHTRHAAAMDAIRSFSGSQIYRSDETQAARRNFRGAMFRALELLVTELLDLIQDGGLVDVSRHPGLASLPHARLDNRVPLDPALAFPWLLDQITLMSDGEVLALSQRACAG